MNMADSRTRTKSAYSLHRRRTLRPTRQPTNPGPGFKVLDGPATDSLGRGHHTLVEDHALPSTPLRLRFLHGAWIPLLNILGFNSRALSKHMVTLCRLQVQVDQTYQCIPPTRRKPRVRCLPKVTGKYLYLLPACTTGNKPLGDWPGRHKES